MTLNPTFVSAKACRRRQGVLEWLYHPMITDFRLNVFETVARLLSFTKAAEELFITQPAVTRHIKELERLLDVRLFQRRGRDVILTTEGGLLLTHARALLKGYNALNEEMAAGRGAPVAGELSLGASTTMAQYVLPPLLAQFHLHYPAIRIRLKSGNSEEIEQAVREESVQLGIVEGTATQPDLHYLYFMADEIILVGGRMASIPREGAGPNQLTGIPLLMREQGSGTRRVSEAALQQHGLAPAHLNILMTLGNTESIKLYLAHSPACAFLSILAVRDELNQGTLQQIPLRNMVIHRAFHFVMTHGDHNRINELFIHFCLNHYNRL